MAERSENDLKIFGENLRNIRTSKKLSTEKLANIAELELVQINRIELGKTNPKLSTIYALARALEISPAELFKMKD
ncbi:helix-turn-helix domain-containing protein [Mucilaginibacter sp. HMF5004]|uniref:helix-turn-helix domain-containing protein n=1 Tax=Mucilaginibacter rivuli TaxID=2857527 RepID=UPI001C5F1EA8|nr:helix-turn-helix transcriptional regulator [Mucilaginibacter rivuli]MBW4889214.1 helix-turn-helix domain-containing protein [Mucilaginibacter rivuli]